MSKHPVLGVQIDSVELDDAVEIVLRAAHGHKPLGVSALAVHGVMEAVQDPELQYRINDLEMVVADGQPVRWALNWLHGTDLAERVAGPDLTLALLSRAETEDLAVFFFGSTSETLDAIRTHCAGAYPGLKIAGMQASRFRPATEDESRADVATIRTSGAAIVFVGLGCPRQEIWAQENRIELEMPVLAVGAAFDFLAGNLERAPVWMQRRGLEWLYRLAQEPGRLWRRYVLLNPAYLVLIVAQKLGLKSIPPGRSREPATLMRPS